MVKFKFGLYSFMFGLMLGVAPAWADVDISGKEKVEVGSWGELKAAVEDSQNAGKVIVLTGNIQADKNNPIDTVAGAGIIIDGGGFTITGQEGSSNGQFINFYSSDKTDLIIQNVKLEGFGNVRTGSYASGGAIYNSSGTIGDISGDFSNNYAKSDSGTALGGAIYNDGTISNITSTFTGNYAESVHPYAYGGAIYNNRNATIGNITGDFEGNYAKSDSGSAVGGAIANAYGATIGDISGDFSNNYAISTSAYARSGAIDNDGTIGDITGDFINNYAKSDSDPAYGGAIYNDGSKAEIGNITATFTGNYAQGKFAFGGTIYNQGTIGDITGDFSGNYAQSTSDYAYGGAIDNSGTIGDISGDFSGNYAQSTSNLAQGGAIYNTGTMTLVNSSFYDNFVETGAEKDSANGKKTQGGAIYSTSDLTIKADDGESIFRGNKVKWANGEEDSSGIYLGKPTVNLTLDSRNNGLIQFDDKIISRAEIDDVFAQKFANANISNDGEGGYFIEQNGVTKHYKKTDNGFLYYEDKVEKNESTASEEEVQQEIQQIKDKNYDIKQDGENYIVSGKQDGMPVIMELIKQTDGTYNMIMSAVFSQEEIEGMLQQVEESGAVVKDDGNGGYIVEMGAESIHISKTENGFAVPMEQQGGISSEEVQAQIEEMKKQNIDIVQDGENYSYTQEKDGKKIVTQYIKQSDGNYAVIVTTSWTETDSFTGSTIGSTMVITGDSSSKVVFNNAIEKVAKIDISGTNVDVNEGAGTISKTVTHDGGVLNINSGAKAEDSIINDKGTLNVADKAEINRTEINEGGILNVAAGGLAQDTTVNSGGKLSAEAQARLNNMLANGGAILDIDSGAVLTGNIIIHADAEMGGSYDYSQIFKDEVTEDGSLTLVGGLNGAMTESSLVNTTDGKRLHLTAGDYVIGDGAQAVEGWDMLTFKDNANVKLEGDITLTGPNKKLIIENGSSLDLAGNSPSNYTITGSVSNDGSMNFTHSGDDADDITTIYGNYTAYNKAQMTIDVNPTANTSDLLRVDGDVAGTTDVVLNIVGADVRPTERIKFVEALNDDLSTGAYFNIFRVDGSAFKWNSLYQDGAWYTGTDDIISDGSESGYGDGDKGNIEDDENLEDDAVLPPNFPDVPSGGGGDSGKAPSVVGEAIAYMGLPSAGIEQTRDMTRNITNKVASTKVYSQECHGFYDCEYDGKALRNAWAAPVYSYSDVKAPYSYEAEISGFEGGFDIQSDVYNRLGVFASYRQGSYDFDGDGDDYYSKVGADMDIDSYILGLYHRYDEGKLWTMGQIFLGYQDVSMSSDDGVSSSTDGIEFGAAVEGGLIFNPMTNLTIEPIIRLAYTQINYDDATDNYGKTAKYDDVRNIEVEAGVKVEKTYLRKNGYAKLYVKPSIIQNIGSGDVQVTSLRKVDGLENSTLGRIEVGGSMSFDEQWSGYANAAYTFGSDYTNLGLNAGLNYAF